MFQSDPLDVQKRGPSSLGHNHGTTPVCRHHGHHQLALWIWQLRPGGPPLTSVRAGGPGSALGGSNRLEALPDSLGQLSLLQERAGLS